MFDCCRIYQLAFSQLVRKEFIFRSQICIWFSLSPYQILRIVNVIFILLNFNLVGLGPEQIFTQSAAKRIYYIFMPVTNKINVLCSDDLHDVRQNNAITIII